MGERPTWPSLASPLCQSLSSPTSQAVTALPGGSVLAVQRAAGKPSPDGVVVRPLRRRWMAPVCLRQLGMLPLCNLPITKQRMRRRAVTAPDPDRILSCSPVQPSNPYDWAPAANHQPSRGRPCQRWRCQGCAG